MNSKTAFSVEFNPPSPAGDFTRALLGFHLRSRFIPPFLAVLIAFACGKCLIPTQSFRQASV
jgi:hypothetical protein